MFLFKEKMAIFVQSSLEHAFSEQDIEQSAIALAMQQHKKEHEAKHPGIPLKIKPLETDSGELVETIKNQPISSISQLKESNTAYNSTAGTAYNSSQSQPEDLLVAMGCACGERIMARFNQKHDDESSTSDVNYSKSGYANNLSGVFVDVSYKSASSSYK